MVRVIFVGDTTCFRVDVAVGDVARTVLFGDDMNAIADAAIMLRGDLDTARVRWAEVGDIESALSEVAA